MPLRSVVTIAIAALLPAPASAQNPRPAFDRAWSEFARQFHHALDTAGVVGGTLWVLSNGTPVAREFHGFADVEQRRLVDEHTIFHWASITKTFTAVAIMQLRDRGRLSLSDPITMYLPELRRVHNPYGSMDAITIEHLLTHSAGFRAPTWPWGGREAWHPHEPTEWSQIVAMLPYTEILFAPGTRYSYSNPGIIFLGRVIEILSGDDYEVYVDKNILKPLGMHRSYFDVTPYHLLQYRSNNYTVRDGRPVANGLDFDTGITASNSGLNAPVTDMAKFLAFLTAAPGRDQDGAVLQRSSLEEMWRARLPMSPQAGRDSIGLVFFVTSAAGRRYIGHTGSQKSFRSFIYVDPPNRTAVIGAFNTVGEENDPPNTSALTGWIRTALFEDLLPLLGSGR
jgi:CubicO group peptidase (beta-lactamase class C family)